MAKRIYILGLLFILIFSGCQDKLSKSDMEFIRDLTAAVIDSSRIFPGENLPPAIAAFGPNNSGITLIRPGGRDCYPSFWIRDYAMSLESGLITKDEQLHMLLYTAERQADSTWISKSGSTIPKGSIPDHIRINDGLPVYFPGTYSFENQGSEMWRLPPYGDQYFFIHMVWYYISLTGANDILNMNVNGRNLLDRMELAFESVPCDPETQLLIIDPDFQTCDFGFRDVITMTGKVCFGSILRYRAAKEMAALFRQSGQAQRVEYYENIAGKISDMLPKTFADERGLLLASTGVSNQADVWGTAFAVYCGALGEPYRSGACSALAKAYKDGVMACEGQVRHVLTCDDFSGSTAWEKAAAPVNRYQNGAYWGTPVGWVCYAIYQSDPALAMQLAEEYIDHLRRTDFRINSNTHGGPYECIFPAENYMQNPVYMTSVSIPYSAFLRLGW